MWVIQAIRGRDEPDLHGQAYIAASASEGECSPDFAALNPGCRMRGPRDAKVLATLPILTKPFLTAPFLWAAQGAASARQAIERSLQVVADAFAWAAGVVAAVWAWTSDQIVKMTQAPWETWPLWKQLLLLAVAAFVIYALFLAVRQLWWAALNVLSALASFIGTLIVTLPTILLAGAIALGGLWLINNFHDLSSLHEIMGDKK
jgi:hypothetical protein